MKKKVLLRGPFTIASGYGVHARQIARWFYDNQDSFDIKFELTPWGDCYSIVDTYQENGLIGWIYQNMATEADYTKTIFDLSVQVQLPNEWDAGKAKTNIGVTAGVETTLCNPEWIKCINTMSKVIVPSEFTKSTFVTSSEKFGIKLITDIVVIPESFDPIFENDKPVKPIELNLDASFNFLIFGQLTGNNPFNDRKNIPFALKWFVEEFKGNSDIGLVIKTGLSRAHHIDKRITAVMFQQYLLDIGYDSETDPRITIIHGNLSNEEMYSLYKNEKIKCLLAPTHGEGFFIPGINAAASGLPVLATNWSAHTEFLNLGKWIKFDYELVDIHESRIDSNIFIQGAQWANPIEKDVKFRMQKFYRDSQMPTKWAKELQPVIKEKYSYSALKEHYNKIFII
jgi:hypothetical protein